jgi:hypothetical protein
MIPVVYVIDRWVASLPLMDTRKVAKLDRSHDVDLRFARVGLVRVAEVHERVDAPPSREEFQVVFGPGRLFDQSSRGREIRLLGLCSKILGRLDLLMVDGWLGLVGGTRLVGCAGACRPHGEEAARDQLQPHPHASIEMHRHRYLASPTVATVGRPHLTVSGLHVTRHPLERERPCPSSKRSRQRTRATARSRGRQTDQREIDALFGQYPTKRSAILPLFWLAQRKWGWLSYDVLGLIATTPVAAEVRGARGRQLLLDAEEAADRQVHDPGLPHAVVRAARRRMPIVHHLEKVLGSASARRPRTGCSRSSASSASRRAARRR